MGMILEGLKVRLFPQHAITYYHELKDLVD
jgi:hypothetical protein